MRHSKAYLIRLAHHCACTVAENFHELGEENIQRYLETHCLTSCYASDIGKGKELDFVIEEAHDFFFNRLLKLVK